jgi:hypothetical protein
MAAEHRIQIYPPKPLHDALTALAESRGESVSAVVVQLLSKVVDGTAPDQAGGATLAKLDAILERLEAVGITAPVVQDGEEQPAELADFLAQLRTEVQGIGARVLYTEALADRALFVSASTYILGRNLLHQAIGEEAFSQLGPELRGVFEEAYKAQVEKAEAAAFAPVNGGSDAR